MDIDTSSWDPIIIYLIRERLDLTLRSKWEEERKGSSEPADLTAFLAFLDVRYRITASFPAKRQSTNIANETKPKVSKTLLNVSNKRDDESCEEENCCHIKEHSQCGICGNGHRAFKCEKLKESEPKNALELVITKGLCINCLYKHDGICRSKFSCKKCKKYHNTILHKAFETDEDDSDGDHDD